ncbi:MAG: glycine cleavage system aminomethyltransferase GcvT [Phycisphaeraceae bacterium]|nr:glycine cleavage system aminomethyltransferase GcvT [Phycisphaeraceae bacterium]
MSTTTELLKTPLHKLHLDSKATMVDFVGWEMPLHYGSIMEEHRQTRTSGGFFDVSHMGRLRFSGRHARRFLDRVCTRQILGMDRGAVRYSLVCNDRGGCRDDVLVYCFDEDDYLMVCNAANRAKLLEHFAREKGDMVFKIDDQTRSTAMVAVQGPKVMEVVASLSREIPALKRYRFVEKSLMVVKLIVSRTGYTGEDGVEVILGATMANLALKMLLKDKGDAGALIKPCGLGARDTLRTEAGMPLYGHEISEEFDPLSAGLRFAVKLDKGDDDERAGRFIGQEALRAIDAKGLSRTLVGLTLEGRRSARQGMKVFHSDREIGFVTSGCISPTLEKPIAMAYVPPDRAAPGGEVQIDLGREKVSAQVGPLPFYKAPPAQRAGQ